DSAGENLRQRQFGNTHSIPSASAVGGHCLAYAAASLCVPGVTRKRSTRPFDTAKPTTIKAPQTTHKSIVLASRLANLFLNRNFFLPPSFATTDWHFPYNCSHTVWYNSHGRFAFAYANVDFFGASGTPKCLHFTSQLARPPQISRSECARPSWQNSIATNCPQLVKPFALRSA